jgi:hypothetical protein
MGRWRRREKEVSIESYGKIYNETCIRLQPLIRECIGPKLSIYPLLVSENKHKLYRDIRSVIEKLPEVDEGVPVNRAFYDAIKTALSNALIEAAKEEGRQGRGEAYDMLYASFIKEAYSATR